MQTTTLKAFAQDARRKLIEQISNRLEQVLRTDSLEQRERKQQIDQLKRGLGEKGKAALVEEVAYTWFNRLAALRFMDANDYTRPRVLSPADGETLPEILQQAKRGLIEEDLPVDRKRVLQLLNGELPSADPQNEAYQLLLIAACNQWHSAMPFMFQRLQDYTELLVPNDLLSARSIVQDVREGMSGTDAQNVEIIGWLYQFYISEKKDAVFAGLAKNIKVTADNIPAATQLFTPHWIVRYLVENALGRLYLYNFPGSKLRERMKYYVEQEGEALEVAKVGRLEEIKFCDPACGSGHILVYAFDLLAAMYEEQGYPQSQIAGLILKHNLYGIEIDDRAAALAAFALMMKARAYSRRYFRREPVQPQITSLQNIQFEEAALEEYLQKVPGNLFTAGLKQTLQQFEQAKNFGALIQPEVGSVGEVLEYLQQRDFQEDIFLNKTHLSVIAALQQAEMLAPRYHCVVGNPPYMGQNGMNKELKDFVYSNFKDSKQDLYTAFVDAGLVLSISRGMVAMINQHSWMFVYTYEKFRRKIIENQVIVNVLHLGARLFDEISGEVVQSVAFVLVKERPKEQHQVSFKRLTHVKGSKEKSLAFPSCVPYVKDQALFLRTPRHIISYWLEDQALNILAENSQLGNEIKANTGLTSSNNLRFLRQWQEVNTANVNFSPKEEVEGEYRDGFWFPLLKGGSFRKWYGNLSFLINWYKDGNAIKDYVRGIYGTASKQIRNESSFFKTNINWSRIGGGSLSVRYSDVKTVNDSSSVAITKGQLLEVLGLLNSTIANYFLKAISPTLTFQSGDILSLPLVPTSFNLQEVLKEKVKGCIEVSKSDWDAHETSWDFQRHPLLTGGARSLSEAYATYQAHWREQFAQLHAQEEALNRIFIDLYGLQAELSPEVPLEDITILQQELDRKALKAATVKLSKQQDCPVGSAARQQFVQDALVFDDAEVLAQFISYAVGCMMGRYSLDKDGLILANAGEGLPEYWSRTGTDPDTATFLPDEDGIIPLLAEDYFPDDVAGRFRRFLEAAFGPEQFEANLQFVEKALGRDIRSYFVREFYKDHLQRYKKRPIYWLFSSPGKHFQALVYVHRYRPDTVSRLLNDYVRDFIRKLEAQRITLVEITLKADGSPREQTQAQKDIDQIDTILEDVRQYERDILYPLAARKLPLDLDDGVLVNYNKMGRAVLTVTSLNDAKARKKVEGFDWVDFDWGVVV
jgi:hypothetical protein